MMIADLAVVTARLPYVDRSTLSQAWYDALHLAHPKAKPKTLQNAASSTGMRPAFNGAFDARPATRSLQTMQTDAKTGLGGTKNRPLQERVRIHAHAKKSPHCVAAVTQKTSSSLPPQQETAVIHLPDGERICLITRHERGSLRIIALCAEHMRARVGVALAAVQRILQQQGFHCAMGVGGIEA